MRPPVCRRRHNRFRIGDAEEGVVAFGFPDPEGHPCRMPLNDLSAAGLSFRLLHELPGLEPGSRLDGATVTIARRVIEGDLLVMHVTPEPSAGAVCGVLFYPRDDRDILELRGLLAELSERGDEADDSPRLGAPPAE